jgi:hypothetical protein
MNNFLKFQGFTEILDYIGERGKCKILKRYVCSLIAANLIQLLSSSLALFLMTKKGKDMLLLFFVFKVFSLG